ncbi:MAG TPA: cytochrome c biogenesis protein CcdA [Mycobacteriales bacterium]|jgi:cytochrome c-type biogenesis protein|nr:cytochrome c biogenesis protein CcdA [Mycobacteriales bacterium]
MIVVAGAAASIGAGAAASIGAGAATSFQNAADGSLLLAIPVAALAGLVSFLSPCVLPLVPAYLSYVTGMSAADLAADQTHRDSRAQGVSDGPGAALAVEARHAAAGAGAPHRRSKVLWGSILFVAGFSVVFITFGALFGYAGAQLDAHEVLVDRIAGGFAVVMGAAFMGWLPGFQREFRFHRLPAVGLAGAPLLGVAFGVGWTPCIGPTLGVVLGLAGSSATAGRGAVLTTAYCAGLGIPFVLAGVGFRRALGAFEVIKRHYAWVVRGGGLLLVIVGVLLVTGEWTTISIDLRDALPTYTPPV